MDSGLNVDGREGGLFHIHVDMAGMEFMSLLVLRLSLVGHYI